MKATQAESVFLSSLSYGLKCWAKVMNIVIATKPVFGHVHPCISLLSINMFMQVLIALILDTFIDSKRKWEKSGSI